MRKQTYFTSEQDSSLAGFTWHTLLGDDSQLSSNIYYRTSDKVSRQGEAFPDLVPIDTPADDIPVRRDILNISEDETEIGLRIDFKSLNNWGEFNAGFEARSFDLSFNTFLSGDWIQFIYRYDDFRPTPDQRYIVLQPSMINSEYDIKATSYAGHVEQEFRIDNLRLSTGLRYDVDDLSSENLISPRLNALWEQSESLRFSASAGTFYQAPSFLERASDPENRDLENERTLHFSVGTRWRINQEYSFLAELYYQKLDNLVVDRTRTDGLLSNNGEGTSFGADIVLKRYFYDDWSGDISYSYNDSTRNDNNNEGEYDSDNHRPHVLGIGAQWEINDRWKLAARWKYFAGTPRDEYVIYEDVLPPGEPLRYSQEFITNNTIRNDSFNLLNIRVDYFRSFDYFNLIAFLDISNILGKSEDGLEDFNPRTGNVSVDEGETTPIIGLKFEKTW